MERQKNRFLKELTGVKTRVTDQRLANLRRMLKQENIDIAVITRLPNVRYLSNFSGSSGSIIITPRRSYFVTDFRYKDQARAEITGCEIKIYPNSFERFLIPLLKRYPGKTIGFESNSVSYAQFKNWSSKLNADWKPLSGAVEQLRMIKDEQEIGRIEKAAQIVDDSFAHILTFIKEGVLEREIAIELEHFMRKAGAERFAFELIVASGKRSAMPHATNSHNEIKKNSFLVLDIGAVFGGYCSDMSRTVFLGKAHADDKTTYQAVLDAQTGALDSIECEKKASEIDKKARDILEERGLGIYFGHNLGHGVGLEIHELPVLGPKSNDVLKPGMVFTVEPGVYLHNKGGVRIEDLVTLKPGGIEILTKSPKELIEL